MYMCVYIHDLDWGAWELHERVHPNEWLVCLLLIPSHYLATSQLPPPIRWQVVSLQKLWLLGNGNQIYLHVHTLVHLGWFTGEITRLMCCMKSVTDIYMYVSPHWLLWLVYTHDARGCVVPKGGMGVCHQSTVMPVLWLRSARSSA